MSTREDRLSAVLGKIAPTWTDPAGGALKSSAIARGTRDDLFAVLTRPEGTKGIVYADPTEEQNGIYFKVGVSGSGSWIYSAPLGRSDLFSTAPEDDNATLDTIDVIFNRDDQPWRISGQALADLVHADMGNFPAATSGVASVVGVAGGGGLVLNAPFAVNAVDFGVKSSNTAAQNSAALAALVTVIMARTYGGTIFFPAGKYSFDPSHQVSFPKVVGKFIELIGEASATVFDIGSSTTTAAFYVGDPSLSGGIMGFACRNIKFVGASTTTGIAFKMEWANDARFENCHFATMLSAVLMTSCYAVEFVGTVFENVGGVNVYSSTSCHHLVFHRCKVYNAGVAGTSRFFQIAAGTTDNIVIRDCNFEGCRQVLYTVDGTSSMVIEGCYIEYTVTDAFAFGSGAYGLAINNNWLSLGAAFAFHAWMSGEFKRNRVFNQVLSFDADCGDVDVADNWFTGTSTLTTSALSKPIATFLNSATADATDVPSYQKKNGIVTCSGRVNNLPGTGAAVCQLPAGYRPQTQLYLPAVRHDLTAATIIVATDGRVIPTGGAGTTVRLEAIRFMCAN